MLLYPAADEPDHDLHGILNSLNFEKQTLVFYFIGAALMLGAVLLLPKYIGVYAYPVGLALSYLVCSVCNLIFLCKKCPLPSSLLKKSLIVCALMLPISLIGQLSRGAEKISQLRWGCNGPHCTRHAGNHFRSLLFLSHFFPEALQKAFI